MANNFKPLTIFAKTSIRRQYGKRANTKTRVARQDSSPNILKNEYFLPSHTHTHVRISGGKKCLGFFRKIWRALFSCNTRFEIHLFVLLPTHCKCLIGSKLRLLRLSFNSVSANPTKWSNTLKLFFGSLPPNCLCVFDHFVGLALKCLTDMSILVG